MSPGGKLNTAVIALRVTYNNYRHQLLNMSQTRYPSSKISLVT